MKKLFILPLLLLMILLVFGCAKQDGANPAGTVALVNGEPITETRVQVRRAALLVQQKLQQQNLKDLKLTAVEDDERLQEKIAQLEQEVAVQITANLAFNRVVRETILMQAASQQGIRVLGSEIEEMIRQSRETEENLDPAADETTLIQQAKEDFMSALGLKDDQEMEGYQRERISISLLVGRLETAVKEKLAKTLALEHPELTGEKFKASLEELYKGYLDQLLQEAEIEILDDKYSIQSDIWD